ncbi:hypothetical protein J2X14_001806 [Pantoea alhagi]|uniref:hypothetical protein n=1 Tax=Mixta sp. BE291 TaxID=3158787 RepID=UPI002863037F|nr:hypothetical protein [Pantoea alhagi]
MPDYNKLLTLKTVSTEQHGDATQILTENGDYCLSAKKRNSDYLYWIKECDEKNKETHFHHDENNYLRALYYETSEVYINGRQSNTYWGVPYSLLTTTEYPQNSEWAKWKFDYDNEDLLILKDEL